MKIRWLEGTPFINLCQCSLLFFTFSTWHAGTSMTVRQDSRYHILCGCIMVTMRARWETVEKKVSETGNERGGGVFQICLPSCCHPRSEEKREGLKPIVRIIVRSRSRRRVGESGEFDTPFSSIDFSKIFFLWILTGGDFAGTFFVAAPGTILVPVL